MGKTSPIGDRRKAGLKGSEAYLSRRRTIIHVAAEVFREKGYEAASVHEIASRLDTDRASLYYYVSSKEELLHEVVGTVVDENLAMAERILVQEVPAVEKVNLLLHQVFRSFELSYPFMNVVIEDMARVEREKSAWAKGIMGANRRFEAIVREVLLSGQEDGSLRTDVPVDLSALALFGMMYWAHRWYRANGRYEASDVADSFRTIFLHGFAAPAPPPVNTSVDTPVRRMRSSMLTGEGEAWAP